MTVDYTALAKKFNGAPAPVIPPAVAPVVAPTVAPVVTPKQPIDYAALAAKNGGSSNPTDHVDERNFAQKAGDFLGISKLAQGLGQAWAQPELQGALNENMTTAIDMQTKLLAKKKELVASGADTKYIDAAIKHQDEYILGMGNHAHDFLNPNSLTNEQVLGSALSLGSLALGNPVAVGAGMNAGSAMQEDKSTGDVLLQGALGAAAGKILQVGFNKASPFVIKAVEKYGMLLFSKLEGVIPEMAKPAIKAIAEKATGIVEKGTAAINDNAVGKAVNSAGAAVDSAVTGAIDTTKSTLRSGMEKVFGTPQDVIGNAMRETSNKYIKPSNVLRKAESLNGTNPIEVIQTYGKKAFPTLDKSGKIDPNEAIDYLKQQIGDLSTVKNDAVFLNNNTVPVSDFRNHTLSMVDAQNNWTITKKAQVKTQVNKIFNDMEKAYQGAPIAKDGLPISELDKIKTEQTKKSKIYNNPNSKFEYDTHGLIGKSARDLVEKFTDNAPTKELNKWIQSHYDAIDLLDSLRGRAIHGGMLSRGLSRLGGEVVGAVAGSSVGHPFIGAMVGRMGADTIEKVINSKFLSSPVKKMILEGAGIQDKSVLQKALKYIDENIPNIQDLGDRSIQSSLKKNPKTALNTGKSTSENNTAAAITSTNSISSSVAPKRSLSSNNLASVIQSFPRQTGLSPEEIKVQEAAIKHYVTNKDSLLKKYISDNGHVVNTDNARKLFVDQGYKGTNSAAVQEPASAISKDAFTHHLTTSDKSHAYLYAGGSGVGKTTAIQGVMGDSHLKDAAVVLDGNLSSIKTAEKKMSEAHNAGKQIKIVYVYRDPVDAWINGVINRMSNNASEMGRTVPLSEYIKNHPGSHEVVKELIKKGADVTLIDNSLGNRSADYLSLDKFHSISYNPTELKSRLIEVTKKAYADGKITKEQLDSLLQ